MTIVSQDRLLVCNYANIAKIGIFDNPTSGGFDIDADDDDDFGSLAGITPEMLAALDDDDDLDQDTAENAASAVVSAAACIRSPQMRRHRWSTRTNPERHS